MWLIIQTDTYREREVADELKKVTGYKGHFLPMYRKERIVNGKKEVFFVPLITHIVFLNIDIPDFKMPGNRTRYLQSLFNNNGYILYSEKRVVNGDEHTVHMKTNARLMCVTDADKSIDERLRDAAIPDRDVESLRLFVDQMNSTMTEYSVVDENYDLLESTQDTVMFTEGPYKGFQGIVKQKTVKRNRSRYFYIRVANWTFCIPNARTGRYVVLKEATHGKKAKEVTAWTNVDLLLGRIQALSKKEGVTADEALTLADDSASQLRLLLLNLGNKQSIEHFIAETVSDPNLKYKPSNQLLLLFLCGTKIPGKSNASPKELHPVLTTDEASALISLNRYYISTQNNIDYVLRNHIPDVTLRPFLTPTPGIEIRENEEYATIAHGDFTEYIIKVDLTPYLTLCGGGQY